MYRPALNRVEVFDDQPSYFHGPLQTVAKRQSVRNRDLSLVAKQCSAMRAIPVWRSGVRPMMLADRRDWTSGISRQLLLVKCRADIGAAGIPCRYPDT